MDKLDELRLDLMEVYRESNSLIEEYISLLEIKKFNETMMLSGDISKEIYKINKREYEKALALTLKKSLNLRKSSTELLSKIKDSQK